MTINSWLLIGWTLAAVGWTYYLIEHWYACALNRQFHDLQRIIDEYILRKVQQ
jgi:hypothetical protein